MRYGSTMMEVERILVWDASVASALAVGGVVHVCDCGWGLELWFWLLAGTGLFVFVSVYFDPSSFVDGVPVMSNVEREMRLIRGKASVCWRKRPGL